VKVLYLPGKGKG